MRVAAASVLVLFSAQLAFQSSIRPLPPRVRSQVQSSHNWHAGCPVALDRLRLLTVSYWGFDRRTHTGQLVVNESAAALLARVFVRLYQLRFPIHHMRIDDAYGAPRGRPPDGDVSASFECRQAAASPCTGKARTGHWSEHAYGEAVDLNPVENPYVGCGMTRDKNALSSTGRACEEGW